MKTFLLLLLLPFAARADILFIDTNNSPLEIAATKKAAAKRGEGVIIVPPRNAAQQDTLDKWNQIELQKLRIAAPDIVEYNLRESLKTQIRQEQSKSSPNYQRIEEINQKMNASWERTNQFYAKMGPTFKELDDKIAALPNRVHVDIKVLTASLDAAARANTPITSVVISGHHDKGQLYGVLGSLNQAAVKDLFAHYPNLQQSVRSVFGWGCYSNTFDECNWWSTLFANSKVKGGMRAHLIAGYELGAPAKTRSASLQFLENALERDLALIRESDKVDTKAEEKAIGREVRNIPGFSTVYSAVCTPEVYITNHEISNTEEKNAMCNQKALNHLREQAQQFYRIRDGFQPQNADNSPCNTGSSWLRNYYNELRQYQHCKAPLPLGNEFAALTNEADQVVRMLFFPQVYKHFRGLYGNNLNALRTILPKVGYNVSQVPNLMSDVACDNKGPNQIDRWQLNKLAMDLWKMRVLEDRKGKAAYSRLSPQERTTFRNTAWALKAVVNEVKCIPLSWVEDQVPGQPIEAVPCPPQK